LCAIIEKRLFQLFTAISLMVNWSVYLVTSKCLVNYVRRL